MSKRRIERLNELHWLKDEGVIERTRKHFKILRYSMGLSAQEVGELAGVTRQTIHNLENTERKVEKATVYGILFVITDVLRGAPFDEDPAKYYLPLRRFAPCATSDQLYFESKDAGMELCGPDSGTAVPA